MTLHELTLPHSKATVECDNYPKACPLKKFKLYETRARFYLIGTDQSKRHWKVLKINRCEPAELDIFEDPTVYTQHDCNEILRRLNAGNRSTGGLKLVTKVYGIVGFIKFLEPYYILLVTKQRLLGAVSGFPIYGVGASRLICIPHPSFQTKVASSQAENRYKKLFNSIDLTKDFFFSYEYHIMWSMQKNVLQGDQEKVPYDNMFVWNAFITYQFREKVRNLQWLVAIVHGFFKQVKLLKDGTTTITLIARRSRHFAGTRYLKRGVNENGQVANDVETEQLIQQESEGKLGQVSSVVQHRGSIPLFWSQDTSILSPRPDIKLKKVDFCYIATKLHFEELISRYGNPIIVLNLIKSQEKKPRETILCKEYANAIAYLNQVFPEKQQVNFVQGDFQKLARKGCKNVLEVLGAITNDALNQVGFYCSSKPTSTPQIENEGSLETSKRSGCLTRHYKKTNRLQHGVLRTNCIDCLDRTNVAQFSFGLAALCRQLQDLGLNEEERISPDSKLGRILMRMYEEMGDVLALQYGGSTAHNTVLSTSRGNWKAATQSLDFLRAIKRHYSNAYTDGLKQDAINIFLGHYRPELGEPSLWQLDSDNHLHLRRACYHSVGDGKCTFRRSFSTGGRFQGQAAKLMQAPHFPQKNLNASSEEVASHYSQSGPVVQEPQTCSNKENVFLIARSAPKTLNNKIPRPILIIPESIEHEDLDQPSKDHEELYEKAKEAKESQPAVTCTIRINGEEQRNLKLLNMDQSLNVQSQWPLHKHLVDYSDSFVSWIEYGQTCFL